MCSLPKTGEPGVLLVEDIRRLKDDGRIIQRLDYQGVNPFLDGVAVGLGDGENEVDRVRIIGRIRIGRREFRSDAVRFDFYFLKSKPLGEGNAFEQIHFLVDLQLLVLEVLQSEYRHGSQINISRRTVAGFVSGLDLELAGFGDFVSGVEGLRRTFRRSESESNGAGGRDVILPRGYGLVAYLQLIAGDCDSGTGNDVHSARRDRDGRGILVLLRSWRSRRSRLNRLVAAAGDGKRHR